MKVAIVGCGKQAPKHLSGFKANGVTDFVLYDVNDKAAGTLAAGCPATVATSLDEIIDDPSIDAIDICTPIETHESIIRQAIAGRKHFLCEKPLTTSYQTDRALADAASAAGVVGMVGYIYRFVPIFEQGRKLAQNAEALGNVHSAFLRIGGRGSQATWKHRKEMGGGALNEMAVHMLDVAHWYFGPMSDIRLLECEIRQPVRNIGGKTVDCNAEDWVLASMTSQSGVRVLMLADFITPAFTQFIEMQGDNGTFCGSIDPQFASYVFLSEERAGFKAGRNTFPMGPTNLFEGEIAVFLNAVKSSQPPDRCSLDESAVVTQSLETLKSQAIGN